MVYNGEKKNNGTFHNRSKSSKKEGGTNKAPKHTPISNKKDSWISPMKTGAFKGVKIRKGNL